MLSNKWTFSLTYLVMLIAIGFIVTPGVVAHESAEIVLADGAKIKVNPAHPTVAISVSEADDVSFAEGFQVNRPLADALQAFVNPIVISIDFSTLVSVVPKGGGAPTEDEDATASVFDITDITISAYNEDNVPVTAPVLNANMGVTLDVGNPNNGKNALLTIPWAALAGFDDGAWADIDTLYVMVDEKKFKNADPDS